jgi:hypothetical protein
MVHSIFFFAEVTVIGMLYTHVSEVWVWSQPNESHSSNLLFQQDKAPSIFNLDVDCIITRFLLSHFYVYKLAMLFLWQSRGHKVIVKVDAVML